MADDDINGRRGGRFRAPATTKNTTAAIDGRATPNDYKSLLEHNKQMGKEMVYLRDRLNELDVMQQQQQQQQQQYRVAAASSIGKGGGDGNNYVTDAAGKKTLATVGATKSARAIQWKDHNNIMGIEDDDNEIDSGSNGNTNNIENNQKPPPIGKIKFSTFPSLPPPEQVSNNVVSTPSPRNQSAIMDDADSDRNVLNGSIQSSSSSTTSSASSKGGTVAFSGWARVFFQARHHRSATLLTPFGGMTPWSQDTYLYISIIHHPTADGGGPRLTSLKQQCTNELHICASAISNIDEASDNNHIQAAQLARPSQLLINPPIALKYFYALKVPGSHSGAAFFLRNNDDRKLRKYIFRFEFVNKSVHQSPLRYANFIRSGRVAKKSMARYRGMGSGVVNKLTSAISRSGGGSIDGMNDTTKREKEAYEAHLSALDELLRESSEMADRFVEVVNDLNEKEEEEEQYWRDMMRGGAGGGQKKRTKPLPPYWGSGFNIKQTGNNEEDDKEESDSDYSGEEDEDDILNYDDDNDDETLFDRVQVSTEQTLGTLFNHIVK